ncbi:hypothetical protein ACTP13_03630 [Paenibacillus peoriae]|uniref:hypothetical protein n=1 Tax=Paenibacillus peoriae TaxID=59893 RepID=UPI003F9438FA
MVLTAVGSEAEDLKLEKRQRSPLKWDSNLYLSNHQKESHFNSDRKLKSFAERHLTPTP